MKTLLLILGPPQSIWGYAGIAALIGLVLLLITIIARKPDYRLGWRELVRDIGIGFLVAAVVSVVYESSTRSVSEKERGVDIVDNLLSTFLGEDVWREIRSEVVRTPVLRRNHIIKVALLREGRLPDGQVISFPKCRRYLGSSPDMISIGLRLRTHQPLFSKPSTTKCGMRNCNFRVLSG